MLVASIVGSSWKWLEISGEAPIMSPAWTLDRAVGVRARRPVQVCAEPGRAAQAGLGRLEVAVEVVDAEELQLDAVVRWRRRAAARRRPH